MKGLCKAESLARGSVPCGRMEEFFSWGERVVTDDIGRNLAASEERQGGVGAHWASLELH